MDLIAIAAIAKNNIIGNNNTIPWHVPEDFKFFKETTMGHVLLMGRKTFESIGKILPGRITVVLTRSIDEPIKKVNDNLYYIKDIESAKEIAQGKKIFLAGGGKLYKKFLPLCKALYLTIIDIEPEGDTYFPEYKYLFTKEEVLKEGKNFVIKLFSTDK